MLRIEGDRRRYPRVPMQQPCKICDQRGGKYLAASTRNVSAGGLLMNMPCLSQLKPGDRLYVGVALTRRQCILHASQMMEAIVVRATPTVDDHTALAVTFDAPQAAIAGDVQWRAAA
jgi:hypothetical protein